MAAIGRRRGDDALILGLARGLTIRDAAAEADLGERTAYRRASNAAFQQRVRELRGAMLEQSVARITATLTKATDTLVALLEAKSEAVRLGAGRTLLELALKLREHADIERRLAELEARAEEQATEQERTPKYVLQAAPCESGEAYAEQAQA